MKKIILLLAITFVTIISYSQQTIGTWVGILHAGGQNIEMRLHVFQNADKSFNSSWDVPIQKVKGISSSKTEFSNEQISIEVKSIGALFTGKLNSTENKIEGIWEQSGGKFDLNLDPFTGEAPETIIIKTQTPKPPFNYQSKEFTYEGVNTKLTYGATLTYPNNDAKFPLIILITGSGRQDRDETIFDHKPFAVIADFLTKKGYAVLRVDDRGAGKSTGDFIQSTSADFALDVEEHINYAKSLSMIDTNKIGLCGHSEGGLIAPLVAARNKSVSFIIMMAGPGINIVDLMALQNEGVLRTSGIGKNEIDAYIPMYKDLMNTISKSTDTQSAIVKAKEITTAWFNSTNKVFVKSTTNINNEADIDKFVNAMVGQLSTKWWKYFANYNPQPVLEKLKCNVLAINGSADIQVVAEPNLKGIESSFIKGGNKKFTIKKFEGLNHLFQKCTKCTVSEYGELTTTIEPEVLEYIADWLQNIK